MWHLQYIHHILLYKKVKTEYQIHAGEFFIKTVILENCVKLCYI